MDVIRTVSRCALREDSETNDGRELHIGSDSTSSGKNLIHLEMNSLLLYCCWLGEKVTVCRDVSCSTDSRGLYRKRYGACFERRSMARYKL